MKYLRDPNLIRPAFGGEEEWVGNDSCLAETGISCALIELHVRRLGANFGALLSHRARANPLLSVIRAPSGFFI